MRAVLSTTYGSRGDVALMAAPGVGGRPTRGARDTARVALRAVRAHGPAPAYTSLPTAFTTALAEDTRRRATDAAAGVRTDGARVAEKLLVDLAGGERSHLPG